jgi:hypothetical protein
MLHTPLEQFQIIALFPSTTTGLDFLFINLLSINVLMMLNFILNQNKQLNVIGHTFNINSIGSENSSPNNAQDGTMDDDSNDENRSSDSSQYGTRLSDQSEATEGFLQLEREREEQAGLQQEQGSLDEDSTGSIVSESSIDSQDSDFFVELTSRNRPRLPFPYRDRPQLPYQDVDEVSSRPSIMGDMDPHAPLDTLSEDSSISDVIDGVCDLEEGQESPSSDSSNSIDSYETNREVIDRYFTKKRERQQISWQEDRLRTAKKLCRVKKDIDSNPNSSIAETSVEQNPNSSIAETSVEQNPNSSITETSVEQNPNSSITETSVEQNSNSSITETSIVSSEPGEPELSSGWLDILWELVKHFL